MACKKAKGKRAKTRDKLRRTRKYKRLTVNKRLRNFNSGQKVQIYIDPSIHSGMPNHRYQGLVGVVKKKQGRQTFEVEVKKGGLMRSLLVNAAHLKVLAIK